MVDLLSEIFDASQTDRMSLDGWIQLKGKEGHSVRMRSRETGCLFKVKRFQPRVQQEKPSSPSGSIQVLRGRTRSSCYSIIRDGGTRSFSLLCRGRFRLEALLFLFVQRSSNHRLNANLRMIICFCLSLNEKTKTTRLIRL